MNTNDFIQASNRHLMTNILGTLVAICGSLVVLFSQKMKAKQK
jgi:hypothetical protein